MPTPHIRKARPVDKDSWLRMRYSLWPQCSDRRHALEMDQLLKSGGVVLVAEDDQGELVGFTEVSLRQDHVDGASISPVPYLEAWFVEARVRNQGIGRALMNAVEQWAISHGYTELASDAELENSLSIRLHKQLGFSEMDRNVTFLKKLSSRTTKDLEQDGAANGSQPIRSKTNSSPPAAGSRR